MELVREVRHAASGPRGARKQHRNSSLVTHVLYGPPLPDRSLPQHSLAHMCKPLNLTWLTHSGWRVNSPNWRVCPTFALSTSASVTNPPHNNLRFAHHPASQTSPHNNLRFAPHPASQTSHHNNLRFAHHSASRTSHHNNLRFAHHPASQTSHRWCIGFPPPVVSSSPACSTHWRPSINALETYPHQLERIFFGVLESLPG